MKLTVVVDQPWLVPADVLVVPIAADPAFDGPLGELDRRSGGEEVAAARANLLDQLPAVRLHLRRCAGTEQRHWNIAAEGREAAEVRAHLVHVAAIEQP